MQSIQWTSGLIIIVFIAAFMLIVLGFILAAIFIKNDTDQKNESELHQKELIETKLREQLNTAHSNEQRLHNELSGQKGEFSLLTMNLEEFRRQYHLTENKLKTAEADNRALKESGIDLQGRLKQKTQDLQDLSERYQVLSNEYTELKTTLKRKEEHFKEQMQQLSETKQSLTKEFENLANKIFEEKGKTFTQTSQISIDTMLKPFREQIEGFQKRVNEVHDASIKDNSSLNSEIKKVLEVGLHMSKEANNLTSALKGNSQQRGVWGEAQLSRILEMSGLIKDAHYTMQDSFKDADGKQKQTDFLVKIPGDKCIIIDSKVTLNAYDRVVAAQTEEGHQLAMNDHIRAVKRHIDDLSSKGYTTLKGINSPSFILMFMPIEPAYIEAMKNSKDLFEYGYNKGIVLVSHTTLLPILTTVANLWAVERSNTGAREISEKAGDIYNQVCIIAERLGKLGGTLNTASTHYNSVVTALTGQQGLYGKVNRFHTLSTKVNKKLPQLDPSHTHFETERLILIEPISDSVEEDSLVVLEDEHGENDKTLVFSGSE